MQQRKGKRKVETHNVEEVLLTSVTQKTPANKEEGKKLSKGVENRIKPELEKNEKVKKRKLEVESTQDAQAKKKSRLTPGR